MLFLDREVRFVILALLPLKLNYPYNKHFVFGLQKITCFTGHLSEFGKAANTFMLHPGRPG